MYGAALALVLLMQKSVELVIANLFKQIILMLAFYFAALSSLFAFACTALGSAVVFCFSRSRPSLLTKLSLGFSAGIMIAASVFGLLLPAQQNILENEGSFQSIIWGFVLGVSFIILLDRLLPHLHAPAEIPEGPKTTWSKRTLLVLAITIHNIPEGLALGVCSAAAAYANSHESTWALIALAIGIGIQNIPEGTAVSLPFYADGMSKMRSFLLGLLSGIVEPAAAVTVIIFSNLIADLLPFFLSFAAGAMLYVVIEELIPRSHNMDNNGSDLSSISVLTGFLLMMILDSCLG